MLAAVKVRSDTDARQRAKRTLRDLNLDSSNKIVVFEKNDSVEGMMNIAKDYIAYGEISDETVEKLEERKGKELENGETVRLSPPSGGYSDTKKQYGQGGSLGSRKDMDSLIERMV